MPRGSSSSASAYAKSQSKSSSKSSKSKGEEFKAPQVDFLKTGREALTLAGEAYPYFLNLNRQYGADFARNEVDVAEARGAAEQQAMGRQSLGLRQQLLDGSPEITAANRSVLDRLKETGPSAIEGEMNSQALRDLKLEGALSAEDTRLAIQQARAATSARGMAQGQPGALAEILGRQQFSDRRRDERRAFASSIDSQTTQRRASDAATSNNAFNTLGAFWDPQTRLFGKGGSQVTGQVSGPSQFNSYLGGAVDVAQGNQASLIEAQKAEQDAYQFNINREDSNYWSNLNRKDSNSNAAANRSSSNSNAAMAAGGAALGMLALAFL